MKHIELKVRFNTPAFLGDAEQNARWRTPPFKHALREWWRVAWAAKHGLDFARMREEEGALFGNAWLEDNFRKSQVRMRLGRWDQGALKKSAWPADISVNHPEVKNKEGRLVPVGSALYQGFGPLVYDNQRRSTTLKANAAIQAEETAVLSLAYPTEWADLIEHAIWLMDRYGAVGGRNRNGWGSFELEAQDDVSRTVLNPSQPPLKHWTTCLDTDWPHAIGKDAKGPLIWQTEPHDDWKDLMKTLAVLKIGLRTQFKFTSGNAPDPEERHWLAYPVTHHDIQNWKKLSLRLPNTLRFKVRRNGQGKLVGVIFHVPHLPPNAFGPQRARIEAVWQKVHAYLDESAQELTRILE